MGFLSGLAEISRAILNVFRTVTGRQRALYEEGDALRLEADELQEEADDLGLTEGIEGQIGESEDIDSGSEESGRIEPSERDYVRKFVAATVYCSNHREVYYGLTFEDNYTDREQDLLNAIEDETGGRCSEIRYNHGYSESGGFTNEDGPQYPTIDVGVER